jgi:nicotinamidase-related amidase
MASELIRDPAKNQLLTPKNSALIIIDYQQAQVNSIASMDRQRLIDNIVGVAKTGRAFGLPDVSVARCAPGGLRGLRHCRRSRRYLSRGASVWLASHRAGRRQDDQLDAAHLRVTARLGT